MLYQNKIRKLNMVKMGPKQLSWFMDLFFNPLSHYLCLQTDYFLATLAFKIQLIVFLSCQQNHYSNHVLTQEKALFLLLLHCTFQLLSYCKNHLHAKWIKSHFRPPFSNDKVTAQSREETLETLADKYMKKKLDVSVLWHFWGKLISWLVAHVANFILGQH